MKPTREELESQLLAYVEGQLSPAEAARVEVFLANTDPALAGQIRGMIADRNALQSLPKLQAPFDMAERIMEQVERTSLIGTPETQLTHQPHRWWHTRVAMAAGLFLTFGIFGYFVVQSIWRNPNAWEKLAQNDNRAAPAPVAIASGDRVDRKTAETDTLEAVATGRAPAIAAGPAADSLAFAGKGGDVGKKAEDAAKLDLPVASGRPGADRELVNAALAAAQPTEGPALTAPPAGLPVAATTAVASANFRDMTQTKAVEGTRFSYNSASNAQVALDNLQASRVAYLDGPPVVITLVSRDSSDAQRLRSLLENYALADAGSTERLYAGNDAKGLGQTQLQIGNPRDTNVNSNRDFQGNQMAQNYDVQRGGNALSRGQQAAVPPSNALYPNMQANAINDRSLPEFQQPVVQRSVRASAPSVAKSAGPAAGPVTSVVFSGPPAAPYRVFLRPEQLDQMSSEFAVATVTRGNNGYVVANQDVAGRRNVASNAITNMASPPLGNVYSNTIPGGGNLGNNVATANNGGFNGAAELNGGNTFSLNSSNAYLNNAAPVAPRGAAGGNAQVMPGNTVAQNAAAPSRTASVPAAPGVAAGSASGGAGAGGRGGRGAAVGGTAGGGGTAGNAGMTAVGGGNIGVTSAGSGSMGVVAPANQPPQMGLVPNAANAPPNVTLYGGMQQSAAAAELLARQRIAEAARAQQQTGAVQVVPQQSAVGGEGGPWVECIITLVPGDEVQQGLGR